MTNSPEHHQPGERTLLVPAQMDARLQAIERSAEEVLAALTDEQRNAAREAFFAAVYWRGSGD